MIFPHVKREESPPPKGGGKPKRLLATNKAAEHLEQEVDDRNANEGKADGHDVRENDARISGGGILKRRNRGVNLGEAGSGIRLAFGERKGRSGGNGASHEPRADFVFHFCLCVLESRLIVCTKHANYPPRRTEDGMQEIAPKNADTKGDHEGMKGRRGKKVI